MSATSSKLKNPNDSVMNQSVIKLAWPIFLQLLLGISLGYVDTIMLSNYNETAVGAIGNANQVLGFLTLAFNIISSATGIIVSQYLGAGKKEKMNMIYTVALSFNLVLSIVISFVVFIFSRNLLEAMQVPAAMLDESDMYMQIVGGTIFTQALINAFNSIFASNGKTVFGMIIGLGMNIINICGNALLLYGPLQVLGLGASGAAVSTCASRVIAVIASVIYFYTVIKGKFSLKYLRPFPYDVLKSLLKLGIPTAGENISYDCSQLFLQAFINTMGIVAINAKIYANMLSMFTYMIALAAANATQIIVGHSVGAHDYDFAYRRVLKTLRFGMIISISVAIVNWLISPFTLGLFTGDIALGSSVMFIAIILEFGRTTNLVIINSMKAAGDVKFPTALAIFSMWLLSVGLGWLLGIYFGMGLTGIWIAMAADEIFRGVVVFIRWIKGGWRGKRVVLEDKISPTETAEATA
jgi:putative MATE family efflux protein